MKPSDPHFKRFDTLLARAAPNGAVLHAVLNDHGRPANVVTIGAATIKPKSLETVSTWLGRVERSQPVPAGVGGVNE